MLGEEARDGWPQGDVARCRDRPRRVLHSSEGAHRIARTLERVLLRSRLRPRWESSCVGAEVRMMEGSGRDAVLWTSVVLMILILDLSGKVE